MIDNQLKITGYNSEGVATDVVYSSVGAFVHDMESKDKPFNPQESVLCFSVGPDTPKVPLKTIHELYLLCKGMVLGREHSNNTSVVLRWSIVDVQDIRPNLSDEQAMEVLREAKRKHDCDIGITWHVLKTHADDLFPIHTHKN